MLLVLAALIGCVGMPLAAAEWKDFQKLGGIPNDESLSAMISNQQLLNTTLNGLQPGDVFFVPNTTFWTIGGIHVESVSDVVFQVDGTIAFSNDRKTWPTRPDGHVKECFEFFYFKNVTFTSSGRGTFDGNGSAWWGAINMLIYGENRPRLVLLQDGKNILVEHMLFKNSPYWTFYAANVENLHIQFSDVDARVTDKPYHTLDDLQAFNTDGFDVTGSNVYIHDCNIWNQDDCISVKDGSRDMLFERINCSGLGLVIGSIGDSKVQNITFRDSYLPSTVKGIYLKTRWSDQGPVGDSASISDILYENIVMSSPQQYAIWIGPAQQSGQPCSLLWPELGATCQMSGFQTWRNITLRNIEIIDPWGSPGVLFGNATNPMQDIVFDNVVVKNPGTFPFGTDYFCPTGGIHGVLQGVNQPTPTCFNSKASTEDQVDV